MSSNSLKKNLGYQSIYQILITFLPLITSPYLARVLGASSLGLFSYTQSIANYFVLFAGLGVANYGTRAIADVKDDVEKRSKTFFEIFYLQIITTLLSLVLYFVYILFASQTHFLLNLVQGFLILGMIFDINWLFFGLENFRITVTRNLIIKIITVLSIIIFVTKPSDIIVYAFIMSFGTLLSNLILFIFVSKEINLKYALKISLKDIFNHFKPNFILFIPLLAMSVYRIMDKTMLGLLSSYVQTGFYYNADKVINIPIGIILGISTVMLPRTTSLLKKGQIKESNKLFINSLEMVIVISVAMSFGISSISNEFTPLFFGKGYEPCILLIIVSSPILLIKALSQTFRMQYLIPFKKEKIFINSVILGAIINILINIELIPRFGAMGAVVGTTVAELIVCYYQYYVIKKYVDLKSEMKKNLIYIIFGFLMFFNVRISIYFLGIITDSVIIILLLSILIGMLTYAGLCILHWKYTNNYIYNLIFYKFNNK